MSAKVKTLCIFKGCSFHCELKVKFKKEKYVCEACALRMKLSKCKKCDKDVEITSSESSYYQMSKYCKEHNEHDEYVSHGNFVVLKPSRFENCQNDDCEFGRSNLEINYFNWIEKDPFKLFPYHINVCDKCADDVVVHHKEIEKFYNMVCNTCYDPVSVKMISPNTVCFSMYCEQHS